MSCICTTYLPTTLWEVTVSRSNQCQGVANNTVIGLVTMFPSVWFVPHLISAFLFRTSSVLTMYACHRSFPRIICVVPQGPVVKEMDASDVAVGEVDTNIV